MKQSNSIWNRLFFCFFIAVLQRVMHVPSKISTLVGVGSSICHLGTATLDKAVTVNFVPASVFAPFKTLSKFFIIMAMAAIGLNTDIVKLVKTGEKPLFMGLCCWIGIASVSLLAQHLLGIW